MSLPSNPLSRVPDAYPTLPFCKHVDRYSRWRDASEGLAGLKTYTYEVRHSSKFPPRGERNYVPTPSDPRQDNRKPGCEVGELRPGMRHWAMIFYASGEYEGFGRAKAKERSPWDARPRA